MAETKKPATQKPATKKPRVKKEEAKTQYDNALQLSSPHMRGQTVKDAQWLLAGHSKIKGLGTYKDGAVDGDYGPLTAQATWRAKYWLGYPPNEIDRSFGQTLYEYLLPSSDRPLPAANQSRRAQRLADAARTPGQKAVEYAATQIGTVESPRGSNQQKYGVWFGFNGAPWCCIFLSYCFSHSGYTRFRYSYVPAVHSDASYCRNHLSIVRTPRAGDLACFNFAGYDSHIEFVERWLNDSSFVTVGGNTGHTNYSNGGSVMRQTRYRQNVSVFVRVT